MIILDSENFTTIDTLDDDDDDIGYENFSLNIMT